MHLALKRSHTRDFGWQTQPGRRPPLWKRIAMWFGVVSATAMVTALVASVVTPGLPYRVARAVQHHFGPHPPISARIVADYVRQTRETTIWDRPPLIFPPSVSYLRSHFAAFDPRRDHPYRKTRFQLWIPQLVHETPVFVGFPVEVAGEIRDLNVLGPPLIRRSCVEAHSIATCARQARVEWVVQLGGITVNRSGIVYCRVTEPIRRQLHVGEIVTASGLVLGAGAIRLANGQRDQAVYMVCEAIQKPKGQFGRFARFIESHPRRWSAFLKKYG
jgi:hypothetical protein